ncbi:MAG: phosphatase PAP2 family protein [Bacteroidales bacterium]
MIKKWGKKTSILLIALILAITFTDQSCNLLKNSIKRSRPSHAVELSEQIHLVETPNGEVYRGGPYGFPSSHAANSMVLAFFVIFFLSEKRTWIIITILLWSLTISYSRIYLGVHYPFDLLTGWCIGAFWSLLFVYLSNRIIHHSYHIHQKKKAK